MTIRTLISTIRTSIKELSTDSILTNREIWNLCWEQSLMLIQRETDTKRAIFNLNIFDEFEVKMISVPLVDTSIVTTDCTIYRSEKKLPKLVESKFGLIYRYISSLDRSVTYNLVTPQSYKSKMSITKGRGKFVYIKDDYLYSVDKYPLLVSGLFANVKDILNVKGGCKVMDLELRIPGYHLAQIQQLVIQQLSIFKQAKQDVTENGTPNS